MIELCRLLSHYLTKWDQCNVSTVSSDDIKRLYQQLIKYVKYMFSAINISEQLFFYSKVASVPYTTDHTLLYFSPCLCFIIQS